MTPSGDKPWLVVIPDRVSGPADVEAGVFGTRAEIVTLHTRRIEDMDPYLGGVNAVLAWHELTYSRRFFEQAKQLKVLVRVGVGFDNVDLAAASEHGVVVSNVPDYGTDDVADHTLAMLLELARGIDGYQRRLRDDLQGNWRWGAFPSFRLTGKTLGLVGLGRIGTAVALRAKAFGVRVRFYDPYRERGWEKTLGLERAETLPDLADCDVLSLHAPLTAETNGMIGKDYWTAVEKRQRDGRQYLINTARGALVDWGAFHYAWEKRIVPRAAFDVLPKEPLDETDLILGAWRRGDSAVLDRLILSPHCAFYSEEAYAEMRKKAAVEALRVLVGEGPRCQVNKGRRDHAS